MQSHLTNKEKLKSKEDKNNSFSSFLQCTAIQNKVRSKVTVCKIGLRKYMTQSLFFSGLGVTYSSQGQECTVSACYLSSRALDDELNKMSKVIVISICGVKGWRITDIVIAILEDK